jgi:hypothetical protein
MVRESLSAYPVLLGKMRGRNEEQERALIDGPKGPNLAFCPTPMNLKRLNK